MGEKRNWTRKFSMKSVVNDKVSENQIENHFQWKFIFVVIFEGEQNTFFRSSYFSGMIWMPMIQKCDFSVDINFWALCKHATELWSYEASKSHARRAGSPTFTDRIMYDGWCWKNQRHRKTAHNIILEDLKNECIWLNYNEFNLNGILCFVSFCLKHILPKALDSGLIATYRSIYFNIIV